MKKAYGSITDINQNKNFYLYYYLKNMNCDFQKYITYFNSYVLWLYLGRYGGRMRRAVGRTAGEVREEITKG